MIKLKITVPNKQKQENQPINILGVNIHPLIKRELEKKIVYFLKDGEQHYIVTTNSEFIVTASQDEQFKQILNFADLSLADGNGLIWASHFLARPVKIAPEFPEQKRRVYRKRKIRNQLLFTLFLNLVYPRSSKSIIPERLSGSDIILDICRIAAENDCALYIVGGEKETPVAAKFVLEKKFPDLIIAGMRSGFSKTNISDTELVNSVNKAKPDVLFVALGHPSQEKWIYRNLDKMPSVKLAIGIGGSLDFLSGKRLRAPGWMRRVNLEWLFRFLQEPKRYYRIRRAVWQFPRLVYRHKIFECEKPKDYKDNQKINNR